MGVSKSKSSDRSSLGSINKDARTQPRLIVARTATWQSRQTKPEGQKKAMHEKVRFRGIFSKRILTIREERVEKYRFVTVGCWMCPHSKSGRG